MSHTPSLGMGRSQRLRGTLSFGLTAALLVLGCEEDPLTATLGGYVPSDDCEGYDCDPYARLDAGSQRLDMGTLPSADAGTAGGGADSGAGTVDSGQAGVDTGGSTTPDAGFGGTTDTGVPSTTRDSGTGGRRDTGGGGPAPRFLNLSSAYRTHYVLDLSEYLGGVGNLAGPLDTIDQALAGNISTGFAPLDQLIAQAIAQFIPPWVVTVVDVLNSIANFFEDVEANGTMNLSQALPIGTTSALHGTEDWSTLTVRIIDACPRGRQDPNYPACARQNVPIASRAAVGPFEVGVDVKPFDGVLQAGVPAADFVLEDREVDMELTKLVRVVIDLAINIGTNGQVPSLADALGRAIDCPGLEREAERLARGIGLPSALAQLAAAGVRQACDSQKQNVIDAIVDRINGIGIGWEVMQFDQHGRAVDTNGNGRPETIQTLGTPDTIDGRFRLIVRDPMGGVWEGTNLNP